MACPAFRLLISTQTLSFACLLICPFAIIHFVLSDRSGPLCYFVVLSLLPRSLACSLASDISALSLSALFARLFVMHLRKTNFRFAFDVVASQSICTFAGFSFLSCVTGESGFSKQKMKAIAVLAMTIALVVSVSAMPIKIEMQEAAGRPVVHEKHPQQQQQQSTEAVELTDEQTEWLFNAWTQQHNKEYESTEETIKRFDIFRANMEWINKKNAQRMTTSPLPAADLHRVSITYIYFVLFIPNREFVSRCSESVR